MGRLKNLKGGEAKNPPLKIKKDIRKDANQSLWMKQTKMILKKF